jgi:hypothetical protein
VCCRARAFSFLSLGQKERKEAGKPKTIELQAFESPIFAVRTTKARMQFREMYACINVCNAFITKSASFIVFLCKP